MKAYFDTNIIIDVLQRREPYYENSNKVLTLAANEEIDGIIGANAITDVYFLTKNQYNDAKTTIGIIFDVLEIIRPVDTLANDLFCAAELGFMDFEDAVIASIAQRENADYIITRNMRDFSKSPVPAITPEAFLTSINRGSTKS